jgi:predicted N-acetyltransferase YhbS
MTTASLATTIDFANEFTLTDKVKSELTTLLGICFPDTKYHGRNYYKQLPHSRLIMSIDGRVIGQVAMDYRAMNLNEKLVHVLGAVDMAIHPDYQGLGLGTLLMNRLEQIAIENKNNIDFLYLVTGVPLFYEKIGYKRTSQKVSWMKIHQNKNQGMAHEQIEDTTLMYKSISDKHWQDGDLDMLGYWY